MTDLFSLNGKVALVTGASRGIGLAVAQEMALAGARVMLNGIDAAEGVQAHADLAAQGLDTAFQVGDVGNDADLDRLVAVTEQSIGAIDILVCNAGIGQTPAGQLQVPEDEYDALFHVNLRSALQLCRRVVPGMAARRDGAVILMSSLSGLRGNRAIGAYGMTKAALAQLGRNLAVEYGPSNVRVNAISPGLIETGFAAPITGNPDLLGPRLLKTPLRRMGLPREIAGAAVFLASAAGAFVTGQNLVVDGGTLVAD